ncbi:MAG: hypothetical protein R3E97_08870 [Candidatus Eisenbacteria bacterium]
MLDGTHSVDWDGRTIAATRWSRAHMVQAGGPQQHRYRKITVRK